MRCRDPVVSGAGSGAAAGVQDRRAHSLGQRSGETRQPCHGEPDREGFPADRQRRRSRRSKRSRSNRCRSTCTLFLDTSGSTAGKLDDMKRDVQGIVKMLRPGDRFRLLTIGDSVDEPVPLGSGGHRGQPVVWRGGRHFAGARRARAGAAAPSRSRSPPPRRRHDRSAGLRQRRLVGAVARAGVALRGGAAPRRSVGERRRCRVSHPHVLAARTGRRAGDHRGGRGAHRRDAARSVVSCSGRRCCARFGRSSTSSVRATCCATRHPASDAAAGTRSSCEVPSMSGVTIRARQGYFD